MPVNVEHKITVADLKVGDKITSNLGRFNNLGNGATVEELDKKTVWADVKLSDQYGGLRQPARVRLTDVVTVVREEKTQDEKDDARRAQHLELLHRKYDDMQKISVTEKLQSYVDKAVTDPTTTWYRNVLDYGDLTSFLKIQALGKHAHYLRYMVEVKGKTILDAWAIWYEEHTQRDSYPKDPTSRSTSVMSNLLEDLEVWAVEDLLHDWNLRYAIPLLQERVAELEAEAEGWS